MREYPVSALVSSTDYAGSCVGVGGPDTERCWHVGKCEYLKEEPYSKRFRGPYATGGLYYLGPNAVESLVREYTHFPGEFAGEIFEDKAVGDMLRAHQITPSEASLPELFGISFSFDAPLDVTPLTIDWQGVVPPAIYNPGQVVDFRFGGNSCVYVSLGWSHQEPWGTWTDGCEARICLLLEEPFKAGAKLCSLVSAFVSPSHPVVRVEVECNGRMVALWVLDRPEATEISAIIPPGIIDGERVIRFCFRIIHPASPYGLGYSGDRRLLGLGFSELRVERI
jgi:hypothetical protein